MIRHTDISRSELRLKINGGEIRFAGNARLKIYGRLSCASGKRMKRANRVFFADQAEAVRAGFRPCGHCMRAAYRDWATSRR